jgi:hypothetical protein
MIQLTRLPENFLTYVKPPASVADGDESELENWIRARVKEGVCNLHIKDCFLQTITNLESELVAQRYKVFLLPILGFATSAEFFLESSTV